MGSELNLVLTLTGALTAALLFGLVTQKLRLSPIVGYLFAGIVVGPFTPGLVVHPGLANQFAELGVILLMFGVGLNLRVEELLAVRRVALPGSLLAMAVATGLGFVITRSFGWSPAAGVVYGLALAMASTVVMLRVLADNDMLHTATGHVAVGWLLVEDLFTVLVVVLIPVIASGNAGGGPSSTGLSLLAAVAKIAVLIAFTVVVGRWAIPKALALIASTRSRELFTLAVLVLALGIAVGAAELFGASMALGAFLAGIVVGQSRFGSRAASEALPMRDAFAVLFFVATGMLLDPAEIAASLGLTLATLGVIFFGKPLVALAVISLSRRSAKTAVGVSLGLAQVGEFSFMIVGLGAALGILPESAMQSLVAAAIVSITLNPIAFRAVGPISKWLASAKHLPQADEQRIESDPAFRAIVVGYGPVGRSLVRLLTDNGIEPTVIELNDATVAELQAQGVRAIYGDGAQHEILDRAGVRTAGTLIFSASGPSKAVVQAAKELNPNLRIVARAAYAAEVPALRAAKIDEVACAEAEVALAMAEHLLARLGATDEQLDRERDRVRAEVIAGGLAPDRR